MNARSTAQITLDVIDVGERLRAIDSAHVDQLAESIARRGLDAPITVRRAASGRYELVAGAHRLAACRMLGHAAIDAFVIEADDDTAKLVEIEENLVRHDLSELDRAVFLARWKELYSQIAGVRGRGRPVEKKGANSPQYILPFSEAVHARLRMHPRNVNKAVARAHIAPELRAVLAGHPAANNGSILDMLAALSLDDQLNIAAEWPPNWSIGEVRERIAEARGQKRPAAPDIFVSLVKLWEKASADEKARFREFIAPRSGRGKP